MSGLEDAMASTQAEVRALFDRRAEAIQARDIEHLMALYAPEIVYFDLVPPLRYAGADALRERFSDWFGRWQSGIGQETRDVTISVDGEVAAAHMLVRTSGTLADGRGVGYWVRVSNICRRSQHGWLMTHEHVSLPIDLERGGVAVMDLMP
jgi:ketosteroid isomerase-like protein